jgi:succinate dehydrogenase / fumarate reductase cytochrome b subunit
MSVFGIFKNTLFRKIIMALTGLFLAFFLIIHLLGNLQLLLPYETAEIQYNQYSAMLSGFGLIKVVSIFLYATIVVHIINSLVITIENYRSSGKSLEKDSRGISSTWYSRNMGILGFIIMLFLILHLRDYWYVYKFGELPLDANGNKDIFAIVHQSFQQGWYVILYVIGFIALGFHLSHGVWSAFRTLGVYNRWYIKASKYLSFAFAIILCLAYAIIPVIIYFKNL